VSSRRIRSSSQLMLTAIRWQRARTIAPHPPGRNASLVQHLAADVDAVVKEVAEDGRRLRVLTIHGGTIEFTLRRSTGKFQAAGSGPLLKLRP
jgi:phage replication-related protein YjqB (UPF0714/DUF867 family)